MSAETERRWLILLAQLPASPSSARVAVWRRLRAAGAIGLMNGASVLPDTAVARRLFEEIAASAHEHGGQAFVFDAVCNSAQEAAIIERLRADRRGEYAELKERCDAFLAEIEKERRIEKFTFAELEELEDDYEKLEVSLAKIRARDFAPGEELSAGEAHVAACRCERDAFAEAVYAREGLDVPRHG
ncbi:MAG: hypothetical protein JWM91_2610 [Rhodospirillales bacterium]|nr:hypothetical protein [Rhodospirillales bacterium]